MSRPKGYVHRILRGHWPMWWSAPIGDYLAIRVCTVCKPHLAPTLAELLPLHKRAMRDVAVYGGRTNHTQVFGGLKDFLPPSAGPKA